MSKGIDINEKQSLKLIKAIFSNDDYNYDVIETTNFFKVTDEDKFDSIARHIKADVLVIKEGEKVSLVTHDGLCDCVPLDVEDIENYDGECVNTLELLQEVISDDEVIILQSLTYCKVKDELETDTMKITKKEIKYI